MRKLWLLGTAGVVAGALTSCANDPTGPVADRPSTAITAAAPSRVISGRCNTSYEVSNQVFLPPPNEDVLVSLTATHTGTCLIAHLGRTTLANVETVVFDESGVHLSGNAVTFTAANGDQLRASETADLGAFDAEGGFTATGTWTFSGGTGRFAGASGRVDFIGSGSVVTSTTERSLKGWISY
jgi:hypothetical protein